MPSNMVLQEGLWFPIADSTVGGTGRYAELATSNWPSAYETVSRGEALTLCKILCIIFAMYWKWRGERWPRK